MPYATGETRSRNFPVTVGLPHNIVSNGLPSVYGAFVTKISAAGDRIVYSGVVAGFETGCAGLSGCELGSRVTYGADIAVDAGGSAFVMGNTNTYDLPTTDGAFASGGNGGFVMKINAAGTGLSYLTKLVPPSGASWIFGPPSTTVAAIAVDQAGNAYLTGRTNDPAFPATRGSYQPLLGSPLPPNGVAPSDNAFVAVLNAAGRGLVWASFLGAEGGDSGTSIALDPSGGVWVAGQAFSPSFPNAQGWSQGHDFIAGFSLSGSTLSYAARYPENTVSSAITVDPRGVLHVAGSTGIVSAIAPEQAATPRIFGISNAAQPRIIDGRVAPGEVISIYGPHIGPDVPVVAAADPSGYLPSVLGGVRVMVNDIPAPLLYVSTSQINAVAPLGIVGQSNASFRVVSDSPTTGPEFPVAVIDADPGIFVNADGNAAINQDGSINSQSNPAKTGSAVSLWFTGADILPGSLLLQDGQIALSAQSIDCCILYSNILGRSPPLIPLYVGTAPGLVAGVFQINFEVPSAPGSEPYSMTVVVSSNNQFSNAATVWIAKP